MWDSPKDLQYQAAAELLSRHPELWDEAKIELPPPGWTPGQPVELKPKPND
jgi:hypothetical protein